jgi:hypothetical protein
MERGQQPHHRLTAGFWGWQVALLVLAVLAVVGFLPIRRQVREIFSPLGERIILAWLVLLVSMALLIWIAAATGIK